MMSLCPSSAAFSGLSFGCLPNGLAPSHGHFHAYYQGEAGIFGVDPVELIAGSLPRRQLRLVEAWAEMHQTELTIDWQRLQEGQKPTPIDPLK
jgi:hypothetical protein